jgi:hypothetical protein
VSQSTPHLPSHGTVNIILANPQGMIIMTDSMLSSDGKPEFYGEKLFRFDESTYLTLAGQYVEPGPDFGQTQQYPAIQVIPALINDFIATSKYPANYPMEKNSTISLKCCNSVLN